VALILTGKRRVPGHPAMGAIADGCAVVFGQFVAVSWHPRGLITPDAISVPTWLGRDRVAAGSIPGTPGNCQS
jgi:hypothetical protein